MRLNILFKKFVLKSVKKNNKLVKRKWDIDNIEWKREYENIRLKHSIPLRRYRKQYLSKFKRPYILKNKYGITKSEVIKLRIALLLKYDVKVPFPDIWLTQAIPQAMPKFDFSIKESELIAPFPKEILNLSELKFNV